LLLQQCRPRWPHFVVVFRRHVFAVLLDVVPVLLEVVPVLLEVVPVLLEVVHLSLGDEGRDSRLQARSRSI
jgi:hypothetical protein